MCLKIEKICSDLLISNFHVNLIIYIFRFPDTDNPDGLSIIIKRLKIVNFNKK
jgi:hypothetical protein